ncbi:MAG TPA: hypothetical protein VMA09_10330 [Candidatus Binataceae bacterium]|nr:hypothetical protein [Candidatus Binataceae bacterium]
MAALIDSSILIAAERAVFDLQVLFAQRPDDQFGISAITAAELLHGVMRARTAKLRERRQDFVEASSRVCRCFRSISM